MAKENSTWGYRRIVGELLKLHCRVCKSSVKWILKEEGIHPQPLPPDRTSRPDYRPWNVFPKLQLNTMVACDFFRKSIWTPMGKQNGYVLVLLHLGTRKGWTSPATYHPDEAWVKGQGRNFMMWSEDHGLKTSYCLHDRATKFTRGFNSLLASAGIRAIKMPVMAPNANAFVESWVVSIKLDFLRSHRVSRTRSTNHYEDDGQLETFYVGRKSAPIQARIYDKLKKVLKAPETAFFLALWGGPVQAWRVEFQLRRALLRQLGVNTVEDLKGQAGGIWTYLTEEWFSIRLRDSSNTKRRTVHPWWKHIQGLADLFGPACSISRDLSDIPKFPADWYVARIAGCLSPLAARLGKDKLDDAIGAMVALVQDKLGMKSWEDEYARQRIRLQQLPEGNTE